MNLHEPHFCTMCGRQIPPKETLEVVAGHVACKKCRLSQRNKVVDERTVGDILVELFTEELLQLTKDGHIKLDRMQARRKAAALLIRVSKVLEEADMASK